jgi:ATP-dependent DNA helicase PIF1
VLNINTSEMCQLHGEEHVFKMKALTSLEMTATERLIRSNFTKEQIQTELLYLQNNFPCEEVLTLKVGAQVMCIINILLSNDDTLCNGARGIVTSISPDGYPVVKYNNGYQMTMMPHIWPSENIPGIGVSQIPLILAWALTIHKAQGATLDVAEVDAGAGIFECGQTYVALSRVKSLEGLYLSSFDFRKVMINKKVQEFYSTFSKVEPNISTFSKVEPNISTFSKVEPNKEIVKKAEVEVSDLENGIKKISLKPDFSDYMYTNTPMIKINKNV